MKYLLQRLGELAQFEPDWDGYGAAAVSSRAIGVAEQLLQSEALREIAPVYRGKIEPLHGGGLRIDWATTDPEAEDDGYVEVTIDPDGQIRWLGVQGDSAREVDLTVEEAVTQTIEVLKA